MPSVQDVWSYEGAMGKVDEINARADSIERRAGEINGKMDSMGSALADVKSTLVSVLDKLYEPTPVVPFGGDVYRLCNPVNGAHTFTTSQAVRDELAQKGWDDEGAKFALGTGDAAIYQLTNPYSDDCLLTCDMSEALNLVGAGWRTLGVVGTSGDGVEVHRLLNPANGLHLFTADEDEIAGLSDWTDEGVAFKAA